MGLALLNKAVKLSYYANMIRRTNFMNSTPYVINYLRYKTSAKTEIVDTTKFTPQIAGLHLIKLCNLSCDFCSASRLLHDGKDGKWKETKADVSKVKKIFEHFNPRVNFGWLEVIKLTKRKPKIFEINKNVIIKNE